MFISYWYIRIREKEILMSEKKRVSFESISVKCWSCPGGIFCIILLLNESGYMLLKNPEIIDKNKV